MKLVIRADDIGYTNIYNANFAVFEQGIATSADVMADTPGSVDAMRRLRQLPWISTGWHTHMWGTPVLDPAKVPSLYDEETGHFKENVAQLQDVVYEEALAECRAQMSLFHREMGHAPDVCATMQGNTPFARALLQVCKENHVVLDFANDKSEFNGHIHEHQAAPEWRHRNIWMVTDQASMQGVFTDSLKEHFQKYDTVDYYLNRSEFLFTFPENAILVQPWHPGVVDYYVAKQGDRGDIAMNFLLIRPMDMYALCSDEVKNWIVEKKIELINLRDALYGTNEYQNHLREIGSPLYMG